MLNTFRMFTDGVLSLSWGNYSSNTNEKKSFEIAFEEIIGVDYPEGMNFIDGSVKFEEKIGKNFKIIADSIYFLESYLRISESWQQEIVGIVNFLMEIGSWFEGISSFWGFFSGYFPEKIKADLSFFFLEAIALFNKDMIFPLYFLVEMYLFEVFAEKLTHHIIINIVLSEVLYNLFALIKIVFRV